MSKEMETYTLPNSAVDLCFDGKVFVQAHFSADLFLQEQRGRASLETIRDDLGSYLKVLRSATLDLIDHDYADFVGLSSSLVGLDKAVGKIRDPLGQLREEVMAVKSSLEEAFRGLNLQLEERRALRVKRRKLEGSLQALRLLSLMDRLLSVKYAHTLPVAERCGAAVNNLHFCLEKCDCDGQVNLCASSMRNQLMQLLETMLLAALEEEGGSNCMRLLCLYASLDEIRVAEELVGTHIVAPALDAIMKGCTADSGRYSRLSEIYRQTLSMVEQKLGRLLALCAKSNDLLVEGFDFLVNSFWPQFVRKLDLYLPNVSAPGNPDVFHQRFHESVVFLEELEKLSGSRRMRASSQHFLSSWNLQVYFQIRFQELAGLLETAFPVQPYPSRGFDGSSTCSLLGLSTSRPIHGGFWLAPTHSCWECIVRCWDPNTFISHIGHKFWKMSLQLVARYCQWSQDILEHQLLAVKAEDEGDAAMSGSCEAVGSEEPWAVGKQSGAMPGSMVLLPLCVHQDACRLSLRLEHHLLPMVTTILSTTTTSGNNHQAVGNLLRRCLDDALQELGSKVKPLALRCIVEIISRWSLPHLRQCRDIPRLYRRTNRLHPTCPRPYVLSALSPALSFHSLVQSSFGADGRGCEEEGAWVDDALLNHMMTLIFSEITLQYHSGVLEVLTSVHKMEESLRRLKRSRGVGSTGEGEVPSAAADDDEKIRAQLALDVHHFCQQIELAGVQRNQVKQLVELVELVDNAMSRVTARAQ